MRTRGWPSEFRARPWDVIELRLGAMAGRDESFTYLADVVASIRRSGVSDDLAGTTSMHDLDVTSTPVAEPPLEVVVVRAPSSLHRPAPGQVLIEQRSLTGRDDRVERPASEAVRLFWRFMIEKFGVTPVH